MVLNSRDSPLSPWVGVCGVGRLGLICHAESWGKVISPLPGLSRLDNETLITGFLKRQHARASENKLINKADSLGRLL